MTAAWRAAELESRNEPRAGLLDDHPWSVDVIQALVAEASRAQAKTLKPREAPPPHADRASDGPPQGLEQATRATFLSAMLTVANAEKAEKARPGASVDGCRQPGCFFNSEVMRRLMSAPGCPVAAAHSLDDPKITEIDPDGDIGVCAGHAAHAMDIGLIWDAADGGLPVCSSIRDANAWLSLLPVGWSAVRLTRAEAAARLVAEAERRLDPKPKGGTTQRMVPIGRLRALASGMGIPRPHPNSKAGIVALVKSVFGV